MRLAHVAWNLAGLSLPLLVAATTVPNLIHILGHERFGILALAWGLVGYASALDLGIGRALTQRVSRLRGTGETLAIPQVVSTASWITLLTGMAGAALIVVGAVAGIGGMVAAATIPASEITMSILLLAIALPVQAMSATYRGVNEAFMNFRGISLVRIGLGVVNFGGPFLVAQYTHSLPWLVSTLVVSRVLALLIFYRLAHGCLPPRPAGTSAPAYSPAVARTLFSFGGWVALSSAISPVLVQADRFLIGAILSAAAVTAYVLPYEVVVQSLTLVGAITSVIFPVLTKMIAERPADWYPYFRLWLIRVGAGMLAVCSVLALVLPTVLQLWVGESLQPESVRVGQVLCVGVFANALGTMFYALLHAQGRADVTAKLHMIELPLFLVALVVLLQQFGLLGAAWAWVGRMVFDTAALAWLARQEKVAGKVVFE